jgi:hypothetical protein
MKEEKIKRPTIRIDNEEHKALKVFCAQNDVSIQEFMHFAVVYCMKNKILPGDKK